MRSGRAIIGLVALATALALPASSHATFPGANGKIAFVRSGDIWTMNPDGSNQVDITNTATAGEDSPSWSADGKRITYVRDAANPPFWRSTEIWVMNSDGSGQTMIGPAPTDPSMCGPNSTVIANWLGGPAWSLDGSKIAFHNLRACRYDGDTEFDESDLYTVNANGTGQALLKQGGWGPRSSPDGTRFGYTGFCGFDCGDIRWITLNGSQDFQVYYTNIFAETFIDWSPWENLMDGSTEAAPCPPCTYFFTVHSDGTGYHQFPNDVVPGRWSPDGTKFLLGGVYTQNVDASGKKQIASGGAADWQPITTNYARPKGASPMQIFLVLAYAQCMGNANRAHGSPLAFPSCAPPSQTSSTLTVGTPDANGQGAKSIAKVLYAVRPADVVIGVSISDVRSRSDLSDYTGQLQVVTDLRITDKNSSPGPVSATVQDIPLRVNVSCSETGDMTIGSSCNVSTTMNALFAGAVTAGERAIWQLGQVRAYDGGPDGSVLTTADDTLFMDQGIFVP
jgi:hypothetical protein